MKWCCAPGGFGKEHFGLGGKVCGIARLLLIAAHIALELLVANVLNVITRSCCIELAFIFVGWPRTYFFMVAKLGSAALSVMARCDAKSTKIHNPHPTQFDSDFLPLFDVQSRWHRWLHKYHQHQPYSMLTTAV